ncbi:MAG: hypothetical protein C0597_12230 [Marinilabiliales bacterium]|nr:MAG: hypothetical protein C0597_12230 [Marinilabiliales bacterium]
MKYFFQIIILLIFISSCKQKPLDSIYDNIPGLEELSGKWVSVDTVDMEPSIRNFQSQALTNPDMSSISWLAAAPFAGGYHTGVFKLNGKIPLVEEFRWQPFQALRKTNFQSFEIESSTRMPVEKNAVMWNIKIKNQSDSIKTMQIEQDLIGFISKYSGDWQWWYPYPKLDGKTTVRDDEVENVRNFIGKTLNDQEVYVTELIKGKPQQKKVTTNWPSDKEILECSKYVTTVDDDYILIHDTETEAITGFKVINSNLEINLLNSGATVKLESSIEPDKSFDFQFVMVFGDDEDLIKTDLK